MISCTIQRVQVVELFYENGQSMNNVFIKKNFLDEGQYIKKQNCLIGGEGKNLYFNSESLCGMHFGQVLIIVRSM